MIIVENKQQSGFSLIELVTVIILLGILSVFALGRFSGQDDIAVRSFFDDTVNAVRFAQKLAVSSGCAVQVSITTVPPTAGYNLNQGDSCASATFSAQVDNPADRSTPYRNFNSPAGLTIATTSTTITFNALGVLSEGADITVTMTSASLSPSFTVFRQTGLVN